MTQGIRWTQAVLKAWKNEGVPHFSKQGFYLKKAIHLLSDARTQFKPHPLFLIEQPFDAHLLSCSPFYLRSRQLYLEGGGTFVPTLVSSARSLSSSILLEQVIEYSPIERELIWAGLDPIESKKPEHMLNLRTYCSSLFHEQNHRILWSLLPGIPQDKASLQRFMNFSESLVITLDMALADHLGPQLASLFYLTGVTYDPGTSVQKELKKSRQKNSRQYRNYLQAALHATYLNLELYNPEEIPQIISYLFPMLGEYSKRAAQRSLHLDRAFVEQTNPQWQKKNYKKIIQSLSSQKKNSLNLSSDPLDHREQYIIAEKFFDLMGI